MKNATSHQGNNAKPGVPAAGERRFLSPRQLAERWDCTPMSAQRIAKRAGIAKYCLGEGRNGMVRYLASDVEAYEEERRIGLSTS